MERLVLIGVPHRLGGAAALERWQAALTDRLAQAEQLVRKDLNVQGMLAKNTLTDILTMP